MPTSTRSPAGPGINDNGSGSAALLEVAEQMAKVPAAQHGPLRLVGRRGGRPGRLDRVRQRPVAGGADDRPLPELRHGRLAELRVLHLRRRQLRRGGGRAGPRGSAQIEETFERYFASVGEPFKGTDFTGRSDYGPFIAVGIPSGGLFTGAEGIKTAGRGRHLGRHRGQQYDPCYHLACDTFANNNDHALDVNSDAVAYAVLQYAMNTSDVNGMRGKGNFQLPGGAVGSRGSLTASQIGPRRAGVVGRSAGCSPVSACRPNGSTP